MATFTDRELRYLKGQRLARLATADANCAPHVVPVGFRVSEDASAIEIGGHNFAKSKKWRDLNVNPRVAIVIDDLESVDPWSPRGIEVRGAAELHEAGGVEKFGAGGWDEACTRARTHIIEQLAQRAEFRVPAADRLAKRRSQRHRSTQS